MRPSQVLDVKAEMIDRLRDTAYQNYLVEFSRSILNAQSRAADADLDAAARRFVKTIQGMAQMAECYYVSADMMPVVMAGAEALEDTSRMGREDLPSDFGLVFFEQPFAMNDVYGRRMSARMLIWGRTSVVHTVGQLGDRATRAPVHGTFVGLFNNIHDADDDLTEHILKSGYTVEQHLRLMGAWTLHHMDIVYDDQRCGPLHQFLHPGDPRFDYYSSIDAPVEPGARVFNVSRWFLSYCLMLQQRIVSTSSAPIDRPVARRARRYKIPERVQVVHLRQRVYPHRADEDGSGESYYSHQWIVRGHWHNYLVGQGRQQVRRIWVAPYRKGPEGAPLVVTDKVFSLER